MTDQDDEYARAWKQAVERNKPRERQKMIAGAAALGAALAILAVFVPLGLWLWSDHEYVGGSDGRKIANAAINYIVSEAGPIVIAVGLGFAIAVYWGIQRRLAPRDPHSPWH